MAQEVKVGHKRNLPALQWDNRHKPNIDEVIGWLTRHRQDGNIEDIPPLVSVRCEGGYRLLVIVPYEIYGGEI